LGRKLRIKLTMVRPIVLFEKTAMWLISQRPLRKEMQVWTRKE
jgi:hypothetical protein